MNVSEFMETNFKHFNARATLDAAKGYKKFVDNGGKMMITLAGAMSTARLGISLAEMIREHKVHAITCTGANLEEDIFSLIARDAYVDVPNYRDLSPQDDADFMDQHLNRITDVCIPEEEAFRRVELPLAKVCRRAVETSQRYFPHEYFYQMLNEGTLEEHYCNPEESWMLAAAKRNLPIFVPGWEDSTCGNVAVADFMNGNTPSMYHIRPGLEYMHSLVKWYNKESFDADIGFFQIGGGISGDFPICVVPLIKQDLKRDCKLWGYFCQISETTTSYGSYSGAPPSEKITWGKLDVNTPMYVIESDATIVAPLIFNYVMGK